MSPYLLLQGTTKAVNASTPVRRAALRYRILNRSNRRIRNNRTIVLPLTLFMSKTNSISLTLTTTLIFKSEHLPTASHSKLLIKSQSVLSSFICRNKLSHKTLLRTATVKIYSQSRKLIRAVRSTC
jgi:hypothetical protein